MASPLPPTHRALVLETLEDGFKVQEISTPQPGLGNAIVRIEAAGVLSYHREIYDGSREYDFPRPIVGGYSAVGRIAAVGPDATILKPGQLVYVDCVIHGRDDPDALFLTAIHSGITDGSKKLICTGHNIFTLFDAGLRPKLLKTVIWSIFKSCIYLQFRIGFTVFTDGTIGDFPFSFAVSFPYT